MSEMILIEQGYYWAKRNGENNQQVVLVSSWQAVFVFDKSVGKDGKWIEVGNTGDFKIGERYNEV